MKHRMAYETLHKCTDSTAQGHRPSTDTAWRRTVPRPSRGSSPAPGAPMGATASKAGAGALASSRTSATKRVFDRGADPREALRCALAWPPRVAVPKRTSRPVCVLDIIHLKCRLGRDRPPRKTTGRPFQRAQRWPLLLQGRSGVDGERLASNAFKRGRASGRAARAGR